MVDKGFLFEIQEMKFSFYKKFFKVYFEREYMCTRVHEWVRQREGERESQAGFALSAQSLTQGLNPQTEIMT